MKSIYLPFLTPAALLITSLSVQGAIVYVDALEGSSGNTFATGGSLADTSWVVDATSPNGSAGDDINEWGLRDFANDATIFEGRNDTSDGDGTDVALTTQLTGLADGTYNIWAFYWVNDTQNWDILAGLESDLSDQTKYDEDGAPGATIGTDSSTLSFTNSPMTSEDGTRFMYGANLGTATVSGGSTVNIYIDADGPGTSGLGRTWYDGVGYEVVPEPSSFGLIAGFFGLTWVMLRRRRA